MTRTLQVLVLVVLVMALVVTVGCPKKGTPEVTGAGGPAVGGGPSGGPEGAAPTEGAPAAAGGKAGAGPDLNKLQAGLQSYIMVITTKGMTMKHAVKMDGGKPVAMRMDMPTGGYMLMEMGADKSVMYMVDPKAKTATKMTSGKDAEGAKSDMPGMSGGSGMPKLEELKNLKAPTWQSDTVDGVDCWKVEVTGGGTTWIDKEYGLPRQVKHGEETTKFKYEKINAVPDSEFALPKDIKVTEGMPSLPNMPKMPKMPKP